MTGENLDLEDLVVRPGTYFNPNTEVVVIVDDSASIDQEVFNLDELDSDWVHVSDEVPVDEHGLEQAIEAFQTSYHPVSRDAVQATSAEHGDDEIHPDEEVDDLEPDPEFDEAGD